MARVFGFLFILALVVLGLSFAVLNATPVTFNYYFGFREIPLSLIVVLSILSGALLSVVVSVGTIVRLKSNASRLKKQLETMRRDEEQIRILPAGD